MIWRPRHLTRTQREARRLEAGRLLQAGPLSHADIARRLGVSRAVLTEGALKAGFDTERWTLLRIRAVMLVTLGVRYHAHYLARRLKALGWRAQQPAVYARERDEARVQAWLTRDWPRITKRLAAEARKSSSLMQPAFRVAPRPARPGRQGGRPRSYGA